MRSQRPQTVINTAFNLFSALEQPTHPQDPLQHALLPVAMIDVEPTPPRKGSCDIKLGTPVPSCRTGAPIELLLFHNGGSAKAASCLLTPLMGRCRRHNHRWKEWPNRKAAPADLARNGLTLIFPKHTTNAAPIKSLLFTVTFFYPSFLGEIFPPSPGISVTGHPLQNKRPSSAVTQSQYGRLVRF